MILVFGGTGFIGRNLVAELHRQGRPAMVVSRQPDRFFLATHAPSVENTTTETFLADPKSFLATSQAVVYLANTSTPGANVDLPWREASDNLAPMMRVAQAVAKESNTHFIYLSSGGTVYGQVPAPMAKEDDPLNPISPYGLGKKMGEAFLNYTARTAGLRHTVLRPSNPIGIWQSNRSQGLVGVLMRAALHGETFSMLGEGTAVRDYFDVRDLVTAILGTVDAPGTSIGKVWNVGSGIGHSVKDVRDLVETISGRPIKTEILPSRQTDVDRIVLDISRIRDELGWAPRWSLEDSLTDIWKAHSEG